MNHIPRICNFALFPIFISVVFGQLPSTRFDRLYPPSATKGTELEVKVTGVDLEGLKWMKFSHDALKAEPKKNEDGEIVPNVFLLKIAPDAPIGIHKAWIGGGKFGSSNYRSFVVGDLAEVEAGAGGASMEKPFEMEVGQTALGKAPAGKYGWFKFAAKKGQRILAEISTKDIDSKLMPSTALFDASGLQLDNDPQGGLLDFTATADGDFFVRLNDFLYKGGDDYVYRLSVTTRAHIDMVYPPLGKAGTNAKFTVYGRNLPGGQPSEWKTKKGKPLEKKEIQVQLPSGDSRTKLKLTDYLDPRRAALDHLEYRIKSPQGTSTAAFIGYGVENPIFETDSDNDLPGKAQVVNVPCEFVGKFYPAADKDRIRFSAKKGDTYRIEILSERLGRPSHAFLLLEQLTKKADGNETAKEIGQSLETASTLGGQIFDISSRDPSLRFEASADSDYRILVYDLFNSSSDPLNVYRLSIRKESPDFRLAAYGMLPPPVTNSSPVFVKSPTIRKGEAFPVKVLALRRDGFKDAIDLEVLGLPAFISYSPKLIPEGADSVTVLFQASDKATDWDGLFSISGKSKVDGKEVRRDCRFADVCWSSYDTQAKLAVSHIQVVDKAPLAVLGRENTPVRVVFDDAKLAETAKKAVDDAEKASQAADKKATDSQSKLKVPVDAESKAEQEFTAKKKELEDKEKVKGDIADNRIKTAKEKLAQAQSTLTKADTESKTTTAAQKAATAEVAKAKAASDAAEKVAKTAGVTAVAAKGKATTAAAALATATKGMAIKKTAAATSRKALDGLVATKQKPAMAAVISATAALTAATVAKTTADKTLATDKTKLTKATTDFEAADKVAKTAEANSKAFAADPNKPKPEKDKAVADALTKRKLATVAKTALATATTVNAAAMAKVTAAAAVLTTATTKKTTAEKGLVAVNLMVTKAMADLKTAETAFAATETSRKTAVTVDTKAKKDSAGADKLATDTLALVTTAKTTHEQLINAKLNPANQKVVAAAKTLTDSKTKADVDGKELVKLEAELKKAVKEIVTLTASVKQVEKKLTTARTAADKARADLASAKAAQGGRKAELDYRRVELVAANKLKDSPSPDSRVFETSVSGIVNIPVKLDSTDDFKAPTKVKVYGHSGFSKVKEITIDPKKKNEGVLALNLATAKLPAGRFSLFCSAQVKGKYKMVSEDEAKKATEDAKKVDEQLKVAKAKGVETKKAFDEAKKKLDQDKAAKKATEAELARTKADFGKAKVDHDSAETQAKQSEDKTKSILADAGKPQPEKDAAQKVSSGKRKAANALKLALDKLLAERLKPAEQKLADLGKLIPSSEKALAEADQKQKAGVSEAAKLEAKKKKVDALAKTANDAFKKPKDLTVTLFTNPFTLKVRKAPVEVKPLGEHTLKAGEKLLLDVGIERLFGFADQVSFKVVPPKGAKGITAKAFNVVKDGYGGTLELSSAAATLAGEYECQLQGTLKFNNQNIIINEPFVLKVEAAPEKKAG